MANWNEEKTKRLGAALQFHIDGFTPWNEEKELFIEAAAEFYDYKTAPSPATDALVSAARTYREADKNMVKIGYEKGFGSEEWERAEDKFLACRKPLDEALAAVDALKGG